MSPAGAEIGVLTRDGHLSDLALDRYLAGELDREAAERSRRHIDRCPACARRLDAIQAFDAAFLMQRGARGASLRLVPAPEPVSETAPESAQLPTAGGAGGDRATGEAAEGTEVSEGASNAGRRDAGVISLAGRRRARRSAKDRPVFRRATVAAAALASAACLLVALQAQRGSDSPALAQSGDVRAKSTSFSLATYANGADGTRSVEWGDPVHPGERIGFRIYSEQPGYLLIAGWDDRGNRYLCYPQDQGGQAAALPAHPDGAVLDQAVRLDDVLGHERIVALFCPEPFSWNDVAGDARAGPARLPLLRDGCAQHEVLLPKTPPRRQD